RQSRCVAPSVVRGRPPTPRFPYTTLFRTPNQELSHVTVSGDDVDIDVFWPDDREDLAADTRSTLEAVIPFLRPAEGRAVSWMDWHRCGHDQEPPELCPEPEWRWSQERSDGR